MSLREVKPKAIERSRLHNWLRAAGTAIDESIFAVAPKTGARRLAARKRFEIAERRAARLEDRDDVGPKGLSHFRSADTESREAESWMTSELSIDGVMMTELKPLRDRSRLADDNDALYGGAIDKLLMRVFGSGIRPQCRIPEKKGLISEADAVGLSMQFEAAWKQWVDDAGADGSDLYENDELVGRHWLLDGDGIQVLGNDKSAERDIPLIVEAINPARLMTPPRFEGNRNIRLGVQVNAKTGKPEYYHFRNREPGDETGEPELFERIEATRVQHCFYRKQAGMTRGLPWGHRVLSKCKNLFDLEDAEMVGAQSASCYVGVEYSDDPYEDAEQNTTTTKNGYQLEDIMPGKIHRTKLGNKLDLTAPSRPGDSFGPFAKHNQHLIGTGMNFPYELLTGDLEGVSYLSGRLGLLALQQLVSWMQWRYIRRCRRPLWRRFVEECVIVGAVDLSPRMYRENRYWFQQVGWIAPGTTWLDPVKEITAALLAVNGNLTTKRRILAAQGDDIDEIFPERAEEKRRERVLKIESDPMPGSGKSATKPGEKPSNAGATGKRKRRSLESRLTRYAMQAQVRAVMKEATEGST